MTIKISEVEESFKKIFSEEEGKVKSIETVYESPESGDYLKLVISIQGLSVEDLSIIHTKFIFKVDTNKVNLVENSFIYLYDINCIYHKIEFENIIDMEKKIDEIIQSENFGRNITILSDFIEAPAMFLNYYMRRSKITDYSVFDVEYSPKFKMVSCDKLTFDFKININDEYTIDLSIRKVDREDDEDKSDDEENSIFKFQFKFMDDIETFENASLKNIHFFIGSSIAKILDKKLKNK